MAVDQSSVLRVLAEVRPTQKEVEYEKTDLGNARRLVAMHGHDIRYVPKLGWRKWNDRCWAEDVTGDVERLGKGVADALLDEARIERDERLFKWGLKTQSASALRNMIELASTEPGIPIPVDELDADPLLFNVLNGTIDLKTGELRPHDRHDLITKISKVEYYSEAESPLWDKTLRDVFDNDEAMIEFVQRFAGYALTGSVVEQKMPFAIGGGSNGKSTIINTLRNTWGDYAIQLDPSVLMASAFDQHPTGLTDLRGARLVTTIETEEGRRLNEALVKSLLGGEAIRARRMRQDYFEFEPSHKILFAGNHLPRVSGTDLGIWRRLVLVPFDVEFGPDRIDKDLPAKLADESAGILAWAVRGCLKWQNDGLCIPEKAVAATSSYRQSQDHVGRFIADCCVQGESMYVPTKVLRSVYEAWCHEQGEKPITGTAVGRELTNRGFDSNRDRNGRYWIGLGLAA